jgi:hypothetical protein
MRGLARPAPRAARPAPGIRPLALLLPALLLAACVAPPPPPPVAPLAYPPAARERMLRIAQAEWEDWGRLRAEAMPRDRLPIPGTLESDAANFPRVLAYWRAVPEAEGAAAIARNRARYAAGSTDLWREPAWSAAFISFVMRAAGVDAREFPPSAAHAFYLDALIADAERFPATAPFIPHEPGARAPRVGDLVCADRSASPIRSWRQRAADGGRFRPTHCDIVVRVGPGSVEAIGGNVLDAVTLSRFPTDAAGRLLPRPRGEPTWFAVLENRLGCLPPWSSPL